MVAAQLAGNILGSVHDSFALAEWRAEGGPPGPPRTIAPLHLHNSDDEAWYVLEGVLCVRRGNEIIDVPAGSGILVPRGTPHTYWNPAQTSARYLLLMTPNILGLIHAIHSIKDRNAVAMKAVFNEFDSVFLD